MITIAARTMPLLLLLAALATPAQAQSDSQQSDPSIVVTEHLPLDEDKALEVVRRVARPVDGQLARFHQRVCPKVTGFEDQYEDMVATRIKATAAAVGAQVGGEGCLPNLYVVIVDDGREFVAEMRSKYPEVFGGLSRREFAALAGDEAAARSWTSTVLTNSLGQVAGNPAPTPGGGTVKWGYQGSSVSIGNANVMRVYEGSNANPSVQQAIVSAWVVIETRATLGKSLTQIADYAAMRGLAMVRPAELDGSEDTILALFEPDSDPWPAQLTEFDLAYLKGLYRAPPRRWARQQVRHMAGSIARESEQATP